MSIRPLFGVSGTGQAGGRGIRVRVRAWLHGADVLHVNQNIKQADGPPMLSSFRDDSG